MEECDTCDNKNIKKFNLFPYKLYKSIQTYYFFRNLNKLLYRLNILKKQARVTSCKDIFFSTFRDDIIQDVIQTFKGSSENTFNQLDILIQYFFLSFIIYSTDQCISMDRYFFVFSIDEHIICNIMRSKFCSGQDILRFDGKLNKNILPMQTLTYLTEILPDQICRSNAYNKYNQFMISQYYDLRLKIIHLSNNYLLFQQILQTFLQLDCLFMYYFLNISTQSQLIGSNHNIDQN